MSVKENPDWKKKDFKAFVDQSNDMNDVYENNEEYNRNKSRKISTVFDDMMDDMLSNKKQSNINWNIYQR